MNSPKVNVEEYIQFLVASPMAVSGTEAEAARVHAGPLVAHDAYTHLLHPLEPGAATLWQEAQVLVTATSGGTGARRHDAGKALHMGLVTRHWSGKHHAVVQGINLLTLLWSDGQALVPMDYRLYDKNTDALSKNDHLQALLRTAQQRPAMRLV